MTSIKILVDNYVKVQDLVAEHGISFFIEHHGKIIIFDTGQTKLLLENAKKLKAGLKDLDCIALSHGHYDHTGGLMPLLEHIDRDIKVYAHPHVFRKKYARQKDIDKGQNYRYIGVPFDKELLEQKKADFILSRSEIRIAENIYLIGEIKKADKHLTNSYTEKDGFYVMDKLSDDNSIFIKTQGPAILLLGCAHSGVLNILKRVFERFDIKNGLSIIGGLHLIDHHREEIIKIAERMAQYDIKKLIPCHCTGIEAYEVLAGVFKGRCSMGEVSKTYTVK